MIRYTKRIRGIVRSLVFADFSLARRAAWLKNIALLKRRGTDNAPAATEPPQPRKEGTGI
jgi:hypothetical protein